MISLKRRSTYQYGTLLPESRKRGPDVWVYRFSEPHNGKFVRRKVIVGTLQDLPTRIDAARACEHLRMFANSETSNQRAATMRGLIGRYAQEILTPALYVPLGGEQDEAAPMSYHTARNRRSVLKRYVSPRWEEYKVKEFARAEVRAAVEVWLRSLLRSSHNPNGLAPKTVREIRGVMSLVFKFGVKWGYLEQNPVAEKRVELPRGSTKRLKKPVQLTAAQFFYLLPLFDLRERVALTFAGWLGPRVSEGFGLQWWDLDLDRAVVSFRRGIVQGRITPLKTEASRTEMSIPDDVLVLLREWRRVSDYKAPEDWVFASPYTKGKRPFWPAQMLKRHIQPVALKAGLPKIGWHSFRHTVSAWGKEAGLTLEQVKELLRHENVLTTSKDYGRLEVEAKRALQNRMVEFVKRRAVAEGWKPKPELIDTLALGSTRIQ